MLFGVAASISGLAYLAASRVGGYVGFPLDDAWIHQTYARSLAAGGELAFVPGQPSAGSTSPLWTALLAVGYLLRIDYRLWTFALGLGLLAANAFLVHRLVLRWWPGADAAALAAGLFIALEWHMVWAAVSGMETLLFSAGVLLVLVLPVPAYAGLAGLVTGLAVLARPDALTLLPFLLARVVLARSPVPLTRPGLEAPLPPRGRGRGLGPTDPSPQRGILRWVATAVEPIRVNWVWLVQSLLGFGLISIPYLLLNRALSGSIWPNTFYAKQAEYAVLLQMPLLTRAASVAILPFVGAQALLLPGIAMAIWRGWRERHWDLLLAAAWCLAFMAAYVLRLPVTYQHGRYLIPVIPVWVALGAGGTYSLLRLSAPRLLPRVISRAWVTALLLLALAFLGQGALAYQRDVQIIESEMVQTAHWVRDNTPATARVAAHDIGALGYFGGRPLLDLAGLVSPEVIPFIRDQDRLRQWLNDNHAQYLVTFPDWYPVLVAVPESQVLYETGAPFSPRLGGENMTVYRWQPAAANSPLP
jgi:hypothetical protein